MSVMSGEVVESRELRVLISCGFHDMVAERKHLAEQIFPELRMICRSRDVEFTGIDLRAGISHLRTPRAGSTRLGLDEIQRRKPYVVGLLGSDYAGISSGEVHSPEGRNLVDIEIEQGVLADPTTAARAFFYFRRPDREAVSEELDHLRKLTALKDRIRGSVRRVREDFQDVRTLGGWVRNDLIEVIDTVFPVGIETTSLQAQRRAHEGFAASRRRGYLPNRLLIDRLNMFVASDDSHLLITGAPGSGKSALIAFWTSEYRRRDPEAFIISHHIGATMNSETDAHLLRRIMLEIREKTGVNDEIPSSTDELIQALPIWLAHASRTGLLLIIDGANQLGADARGLRWLPDYLPPRIRIIVTTTDAVAADEMHDGGWERVHLEPLSMSERLAVGSRHLEGRGDIDTEKLAVIAREESSSNPLFLRTRLEELHFSGLHNRRDSQLDRYLAARDLPELFALVLERLESDFGGALIGDTLGAIWGSRRGLTEGEIERITGCSRLELSEMLVAFDLHLLRDDGRLRLFHEELRIAVERRYMREENDRRDIHIRIAGYFRDDIPGKNRTVELLWQYGAAGELKGLRDCLRDIQVFRWLLDEASHYELFGYWRVLGNSEEMAEDFRGSIEEFERNSPTITDLAAILNATGDFLRSGGLYDDALPMLRRAVALREQALGATHPDTARSYYDLASLLQSQGELHESEDFYRRALSIYLSNGGENQESVADTIDNLASVLCMRGEYDEAEKLYRRGLRIIERLKGMNHPDVAANVNNLAGLLHDKGAFDGAERLYRRALAVWEGSLGVDHPFRAVALNNLGAVLHGSGRKEGAEELYRSALGIWERALGSDYPMVASALANLAGMIVREKPGEAIALLQRALAIHEKVYREPHPDTGIFLYLLGVAHLYHKDLDAAEQFLTRAYEMQNDLHGAEHADIAMTLGALARIDRMRGFTERGEQRHMAALGMLEREFGAEHPRYRQLVKGWRESSSDAVE